MNEANIKNFASLYKSNNSENNTIGRSGYGKVSSLILSNKTPVIYLTRKKKAHIIRWKYLGIKCLKKIYTKNITYSVMNEEDKNFINLIQ